MLRSLPVDKIRRRPDARPIVEAIVTGLMESIVDGDLINPIRVRPIDGGWEATAGGHRLEAHRRLGLVEIQADVREEDDRKAELAMIDENVFRGELSPAERARYMARRKELYLNEHPDGRTAETDADRFTLAVAKATGVSEATVQQQVSRGEKVIGEVMDLIKGSPLDKGGYLDTLKAMPPNEQLAAAKRDLAHLRAQDREKMATVRRNKVQGDVKARAAKEVAEILAEHVPGDWWDALKSNLYAAGAANIAHELTNITGQSIMDRAAG